MRAQWELPRVPATELTHENVQVRIDFCPHGAER